jgi:glycosyltransferase involved in cell wall biosynthesis
VSGAITLSTPRYWPDESGGTGEGRPIRRWHVLHACDSVGTTARVAEAQIETGMQPSVLTPAGWYRPLHEQQTRATALSLVHEWQQVRRWRQRFLNESVENWAEVVHAHCFAAGMAAMRGVVPVIYDLVAPVGAGIVPRPGAWLLRSLRVAEQFVLSRAGAVVTHSHAMWSEALQRGVSSEELFLVPDPVEAARFTKAGEKGGSAAVTLFAPDVASAARGAVIAAFARLLSEVEEARLLMEAAPESSQTVLALAAKAGVAQSLELIAPAERERGMEEADIVIAGIPADDGPGAVVISALACGRAILAADVAQNREVTPQGRGCLWYRKNDVQDLAGRAAFLARNPDFRASLGISGRAHLQATRSPRVVAAKYDDVYRHAFQRRNRGGPDAFGRLAIVRA